MLPRMRGITTSMLGLAAALAGFGAEEAAADAPKPGRLERAFFGGESAASADLTRVAFWSDLLARETPSGDAAKADEGWESDARTLLRDVNAEINAAPYVADADNWNQPDHWQTARELSERGGDCEDYATAKYFALRAAGAPASALRVAIVADELTRQRHAVLLVRMGDGVVVLDNLRDEVLPASALGYYRPLLALNEENWLLADPALRRAPPVAPEPVQFAAAAPSSAPTSG